MLNKEALPNFTGDDYCEKIIKKSIETPLKKVRKIKKCELIFAGHTDEKKYFENKNLIFVP